MEIKLCDLWTQCGTCEGTGGVAEHQGQRGMPGALSTEFKTCTDCRGLGGTCTTSGVAVLEFMTIAKAKSFLL